MDDRLRAVCDLSMPEVRESAGLHEYDGHIQDLSPAGVATGLSRLGGPALPDAHDDAHLAAFEDGLRVAYGELELHRRNPLVHLGNLDLACYDREYAPESERMAARRRHLAAWPDAIDMAVTSLDAVSAPAAQALLDAVRGLAAGLAMDSASDGGGGRSEDEVVSRALTAHERLVAHLEKAGAEGDPDPALGDPGLRRLMGATEGLEVDLGRLGRDADAERDRLSELLREGCERLAPDTPPAVLVPQLLTDHPDADGVMAEAQAQTEEVLRFSRERDLAPYLDGECLVGPAPESRRWGMAMMSWAAPAEPDAPSWYHVTPPDPSWPAEDIEGWLSVFSRTTLPAITAHEVAPGHYAHGRSLRRAPTAIRRVLMSMTFAEGWAHYVEEVMVEEGFRADDPRFAVGVWLEALTRVTRLACAIGVHTGAMTVEDAAARFRADAFLEPPAALSEARRATFDPTYGRYTWGKLALLDLRERARAQQGAGFSLPRFHAALLALGSPPLGLIDAALAPSSAAARPGG